MLEPYPEENVAFLTEEGIQFFQFGIPGHKETKMPEQKVTDALSVILDARNHPMLIHCNKGKVSAAVVHDPLSLGALVC